MKAFVCELCGSNELNKNEDSFVCAACGTRYSDEEARRIMIDGKVDVSGSHVTVDNSERIEKLYQVARRAREQGNREQAANYYEQIAVECPDDWEAAFFSVYYKSMQTKIAHIESAAIRVNNALSPTIGLIDGLSNIVEKRAAVRTLTTYCLSISKQLDSAAYNHYKEMDASIRDRHTEEMHSRVEAANMILLDLGKLLAETFDDKEILSYAAKCLKEGADNFALYRRAVIVLKIEPYANILFKLDAQAAKPHLTNYQTYLQNKIAECSTTINSKARSTAITTGVVSVILLVAAIILGNIDSSMMPVSVGLYSGAGVTALGCIVNLCQLKKPKDQQATEAEKLPRYEQWLKEVQDKLSQC